jgi:hypothetical protein
MNESLEDQDEPIVRGGTREQDLHQVCEFA